MPPKRKATTQPGRTSTRSKTRVQVPTKDIAFSPSPSLSPPPPLPPPASAITLARDPTRTPSHSRVSVPSPDPDFADPHNESSAASAPPLSISTPPSSSTSTQMSTAASRAFHHDDVMRHILSFLSEGDIISIMQTSKYGLDLGARKLYRIVDLGVIEEVIVDARFKECYASHVQHVQQYSIELNQTFLPHHENMIKIPPQASKFSGQRLLRLRTNCPNLRSISAGVTGHFEPTWQIELVPGEPGGEIKLNTARVTRKWDVLQVNKWIVMALQKSGYNIAEKEYWKGYSMVHHRIVLDMDPPIDERDECRDFLVKRIADLHADVAGFTLDNRGVSLTTSQLCEMLKDRRKKKKKPLAIIRNKGMPDITSTALVELLELGGPDLTDLVLLGSDCYFINGHQNITAHQGIPFSSVPDVFASIRRHNSGLKRLSIPIHLGDTYDFALADTPNYQFLRESIAEADEMARSKPKCRAPLTRLGPVDIILDFGWSMSFVNQPIAASAVVARLLAYLIWPDCRLTIKGCCPETSLMITSLKQHSKKDLHELATCPLAKIDLSRYREFRGIRFDSQGRIMSEAIRNAHEQIAHFRKVLDDTTSSIRSGPTDVILLYRSRYQLAMQILIEHGEILDPRFSDPFPPLYSELLAQRSSLEARLVELSGPARDEAENKEEVQLPCKCQNKDDNEGDHTGEDWTSKHSGGDWRDEREDTSDSESQEEEDSIHDSESEIGQGGSSEENDLPVKDARQITYQELASLVKALEAQVAELEQAEETTGMGN